MKLRRTSTQQGLHYRQLYERVKTGHAVASCRQRPYHAENTSSRPITEVKQHRARLVLGWVTAWEHRVPLSLFALVTFTLAGIFMSYYIFMQEISKRSFSVAVPKSYVCARLAAGRVGRWRAAGRWRRGRGRLLDIGRRPPGQLRLTK